MELLALKYGDLMGSPDTKDLLLDQGPGSEAAHQVWLAVAGIKLAFGWSGQATSVALVEPGVPEGFPAWIDPSFISPDPATHGDASVDAAIEGLRRVGIEPRAVRTVLVTHDHGDHVDSRVLERLPDAVVMAPEGALVPGAVGFDAARLGDRVTRLDTPGHWGAHASYLVDLPQHDLSICIAGDLVMSHAHVLASDHPLAFADHAAARASLGRVIAALDARPTRFKMILPGHDRPFFVTQRVRDLVG